MIARIHTILAVLTAVFAAMTTSPAKAQFGGSAGFADAFRADFLERDMPLFVEHLKLEDWQRPIVEMLLQDYVQTFDAGIEQVKNQMRDSQAIAGRSNPEDVMAVILEPISRWDAERRILRDEFLLNIKAQLSGDQIARWPRFERTLRREKELPKGDLHGESVDLYSIFRSLRLPYEIEEATDSLLAEYELELDAALAARRVQIDSLQDGIKEAMASMDFEAGLAATDRIMQSRVVVRNVQDTWIERIAEALPAPHDATFRRNALERGYPKAFRPTSIPRFLERIRGLPDLSDAQLAELSAIEADFNSNLAIIEARIVESIRKDQPTEARRKVEQMIDRRNGKQVRRVPTAADEIIAEKSDLVDLTRRRILAVLNPEQTGQINGGPGAGAPSGGRGIESPKADPSGTVHGLGKPRGKDRLQTQTEGAKGGSNRGSGATPVGTDNNGGKSDRD